MNPERKIVLSKSATLDLEHAVRWYKNEAGAKVARSFIIKIEVAFRQILEFPNIGSNRFSSLLPGMSLRFIQVDGFPYLLFYRKEEKLIEIIRVIHKKQDFLNSFGE